MITAALILLLIAALFGCWLAFLHLDGRLPEAIPGGLALTHVALALIGFLLLVMTLRESMSPAGRGEMAVFGTIAVALLTGAIAAGLGLFVRFRLRKKGAEALVGIHATLAVSGIVFLAVYVLG